MICPTPVVLLRALYDAASVPIDARTVVQDRVLEGSIQCVVRIEMSHIVQVLPHECSDDEHVADAKRVPMSRAQRAFIRGVLPVYLRSSELLESTEDALAMHGMSLDMVIGQATGWS
jgi:hypothetical protein